MADEDGSPREFTERKRGGGRPAVRSPSPKDESPSPSGSPKLRPGLAPSNSPTLEEIAGSKPPRATPDVRRGQRSPNPSPLSPRSRLPPREKMATLLADRGRWMMDSGKEDEEQDRYPSSTHDRDRSNGHGGRGEKDSERGHREPERRREADRERRGGDRERERRADDRDRDRERNRERRGNDRERERGHARDDERSPDRGGRYGRDNEDTRRPRGRDSRQESEHHRSSEKQENGRHRDERGRKEMGRSARDDDDGRRNGGDAVGAESEGKKEEPVAVAQPRSPRKAPIDEALTRTGGAYIPPFKLARMLKEVDDKASPQYQRLTWDALRKSINGLVNKVNISNTKNIIPELFAENLIRGRGLFARSCIKSQMASPTFTHVFAALVAVVNTKFPELGELLLRRVILQFQRAFRRNDKPVCLAITKFIAHLVNQQVAHEILALELLTLLLERPTDDSVEVAVGFVKECGAKLEDLSPKGLQAMFERFRGILHEGEIDMRVQFMIEELFAIRKVKFKDFPSVVPELDLVEFEDQITHEIGLEEKLDPETALDVFKVDPDYVENERKYEELKKEILGEEEEDSGEEGEEGDDEDDEDESEEEEDEEAAEERMMINDMTETNLVNLRRTIYLTIMSSANFEEAGHKLMKIKLEPGQEMELCLMLLECCSQERSYNRYYGLIGQRFCLINRIYQQNFDTCFRDQYSKIHRLETSKVRNVAKFFAHLLGTDALPWDSLAYIRLTEEDTSASSRIFIKFLFQELSEHLGIRKLNERLQDPTMVQNVEGLFPRDTAKNTRFSINFFTSIGLGGVTDDLREYLKNMPKLIMQQQKPIEESEEEESKSGSDSESDSGSETETETDSSSSESSSSESESSESESEDDRRRAKKRRHR